MKADDGPRRHLGEFANFTRGPPPLGGIMRT